MMQVTVAKSSPCAQCPWRTANQSKPHPHGFYLRSNLRRLWTGLRRGVSMTCHPTDPRMAEFEGYEATADRQLTHECVGAQILIQREMQRFNDLAAAAPDLKAGIASYRREHPKGLMPKGIMAHFSRALTPAIPGRELPFKRVNLNEPGIGHPDLVPWEPR